MYNWDWFLIWFGVFVLCFLLVVILISVFYCQLGHPLPALFFEDNYCGRCGDALKLVCPECKRSFCGDFDFCCNCGHSFE